MGARGDDPRDDKSKDPDTRVPQAGESKTYPAEGGAGTGTKSDPTRPSNQPEHYSGNTEGDKK